MANIERGGIRLVVENYEAFNRQLQAASASMTGFGQAAQGTAQAVNASAGEFRGSSVVIEQWSETIDDSGASIVGTTDSLILLGAALTAVSAKMTSLVLDTTMVAARIKELEIILEVTRQNAVRMAEAEGDMSKAAALTSAAVQRQVQEIRDLHISGQVANETVASLIRYNLDWTRSAELVREAQDAATYAAQDSSQAVEGLIHGITTLQPRILRSYGIMVNLNEAYRVYAEENNLVATELTQAQRQQAAFNAVLAQAPNIAGAYEASLGSASKQIRSIYTDTQNLAEAYGEALEPALAVAAQGLRNFMQTLTELPPVWRATISATAAGGAATLTAVAGATTAITTFSRLRTAMSGLSGTASTLVSSLGAVGLALTAITATVLAVNAYMEEQERAVDELEVSILSSTDSYEDYKKKMEDAGLAQDTLTEAIWDTVHAKEAENEIDAAEAYIEAQNAAEDLIEAITASTSETDAMSNSLEALYQIAKDDVLAEVFAQDNEYIQDLIESTRLFTGHMVSSATTFQDFIEGWQMVASALQSTATYAERQEAIDYLEELKGQMDLTGQEGVRMEIRINAVIKSLQKLGEPGTYQDIIDHTEEVRDEWERTFGAEQRRKQTEATRDFLNDVNDALDRTYQTMEDAALRRNRALEDLDTEYHNKSIDAWIDYQRELRDTEGDLAAFHAGTLAELLDLDREYLQDRQDAWTRYQQDLEDAERELARDIEDANRDRAQRLADIDREYAQDREDALRELNQDLEDAAEDHAQNLVDIEQERQQSLLDLEQEYQDRLYDIQNIAQQKLRDLQDKYAESESDARLQSLREALELLESQGIQVSAAYEELLRRLFLGGETDLLPFIVQADVRDIYEQLLQALAELNDDMAWEEEDLSDDIDREQERRLEDLEEWLAEEQAAIEEAYNEKLAAEEERYAEEQEARRQDYERKLEDLQRALERERAELEIDYQRRLEDIRRRAQEEREEAARNYARRLEDLEIQYNRERELIRSKLEEQNEVARQKYEDALDDLATAKERERDEINKQYDRTIEDAGIKLDRMVQEAAEKYGFLPDALKPTYRIIKDDLHGLLFGDADSMANQWTAFMEFLRTLLGWHSPSRVMMDLGESLISGLEKGLGGTNIGDALTASFDAAALEANIRAAMPVNMAAMPMGLGAGNVSNTSTNNLTVNAQYQHQSEASLRDDLSLWGMMLGTWGR